MTTEERKLLTDVEQAILNIDIHLEYKRNFQKFASSITKRRAIERELEIIGEATSKLLKSIPESPSHLLGKSSILEIASSMPTMQSMKLSFGR